MQAYSQKEALITEIRKTADLFINEFNSIREAEKDLRLEVTGRTPQEMIAYQLGWMNLILEWDRQESAGILVVTPVMGFKWNRLGDLYQTFYKNYENDSLAVMCSAFTGTVEQIVIFVNSLQDDELFLPGGRKWASSTPSNWPIWKWIHINTVAPFKSFRTKIRKWKKLKDAVYQDDI